MRRFSIFLTVLAFAASAAVTLAQTSPTIVMPSQLKWSTQGLPKGMAIATVTGNPNGTGMYVQRLKMADGSQFAPHTHGKTEMVSVLSGTLMAGIGSKFDKTKMKAMPAGTFIVMPAGVPHYVMAKGDVMLEISGMGPSTTKMLSGGGNMSM
ncbi:MAG TPA: cupin domain-containing protein [Candidatus Baltobacteraceae bacterium]|jgi:uncharacterized RmlC-like cupin family protein|nr:cupin domain-containing protein [Candidatus Baltobacteraceae bacterium]